jgi:hypothetical protein
MTTTVSLTTESGCFLDATQLRSRTDAFVLIGGGGDRSGSIFGPYALTSARFIADQASAAENPYEVLVQFDATSAGRMRSLAPSLITTRF